MCDIVGQVINQAIARRRLLAGVGAGALAAVFGTPASAAEIAQQQVRIAQASNQVTALYLSDFAYRREIGAAERAATMMAMQQ